MPEIKMTKTVPVEAKTFEIHVKCTDYFGGKIVDQDGQVIYACSDRSVPGFFPGQHHGDYLILNIDLDTGQITNWRPPTAAKIEEYIADIAD